MIDSKIKFNFYYKLVTIFLFFGLVALYALYEKNKIFKADSDGHGQYSLKIMPELNVVSLPGRKPIYAKGLADGGQAVFVHVWGTWCAPCENEMPLFLEFARKLEGRKITFLLIAVNDEEIKINKFMKKFVLPKNVIVALDEQNLVMDKLGTLKVPESFLFSKSGKLITKFIGPQNWDESTYLERLNYWLSL